MSRAYYNEIDSFSAEWLRNLIAAGHIAPGDVDTRSVEDVLPEDLHGYTQCHFFAGIGGWSLALRLAGWPDDRPVWTGSCPCQPFSAAGKGLGAADERHLWPAWAHLIEECRPRVIFGEQVEAAVKHGWLDLVQADLEGLGYALGAVCLPAAGVGAPHIRSRLWFVAESDRGQRDGRSVSAYRNFSDRKDTGRQEGDGSVAGGGCAGLVADRHPPGRGLKRGAELLDGQRPTFRDDADGRGADDIVADGQRAGLEGHAGHGDDSDEPGRLDADQARPTATGGWTRVEWLPCRDGKARPTQPGIFPLVARLPAGMVRSGNQSAPFNANASAEARIGRLRAYGNSIVPQVAAEFIGAFLDATNR